MRRTLGFLSALLALAGGQAHSTDWPYFAADAASSKYTPLSQINRGNFADLQVTWRYRPPDTAIAKDQGLWFDRNRGTPLMVDGVLYYASPFNILCAVDPATGVELWTFDPKSWKHWEHFLGILRGIAYWSDGVNKRIFYGTANERLYSIDAATEKPDPHFGHGGVVDLGKGLRRRVDRLRYGVSSPPIVCRNTVVVGAGILDWHDRPPSKYATPGDVRGFDAHTGEQLWTLQTVPQEGEYGNDTWESDAWKTYGQANVWAAMSCDEELGYVYLPVSSTTHDNYGGERPGANLFSETLVCIEARTGKRIWHYQLVHHGLWNYDPPAAPVLLDIEVKGKKIKAVAQVTKQAFCFVFDRVTGVPVWPIEERQVPPSKVKGEKSFPTQPFPTKPAAYDRQGLSQDDLIDFTPELRQKALAIAQQYDHGPLYTPPTEKGLVSLPGGLGGSDWSGAALLPQKGILYVPSRTDPDLIRLQPVSGLRAFSAYASFARKPENVEGLPLIKPPYGRITAIDMNKGEQVWMRPVGKGPVRHPALRDLGLPDLGWTNYNFVLATPTFLLVVSQNPAFFGGLGPENFVEQGAYLRAFDLDSGTLLGEVELPGNPNGNPMTYSVAGRQYLVIPINNYQWEHELIALALPEAPARELRGRP